MNPRLTTNALSPSGADPWQGRATVGVFDSGVGGLTVLRELLPRLPEASFVYLGDTARLPYGSKSQTTIARYAVESARFLASGGADLLVIACNTATALALPEIQAAVPLPVVGVVTPAVGAAHAAAPDADVLVLATEATVASHAYRTAGATLSLTVVEKACPLLVPLIEEGWTDHPVTAEVLRIYLTEALASCRPATVILGCTHYPLIAPAVRATLQDLGCQARVIDSAAAAAEATVSLLQTTKLEPQRKADTRLRCYATDSVAKFSRLGSRFLGQPIDKVKLLDLGG